MTPALAAGMTDPPRTIGDLVASVDEHDGKRARRKPDRKPKAGRE